MGIHAHTHTHIRIHTLLTAGSELWFCQHSLPQRSEQYLNHHTVKSNLMELPQACVCACTHVHSAAQQLTCDLYSGSFHWSQAVCLEIEFDPWFLQSSKDMEICRRQRRAINGEPAHWRPKALLYIEDWCFVKPVHAALSPAITRQGRQQLPPHSPCAVCQQRRVDYSAVRTEMAP